MLDLGTSFLASVERDPGAMAIAEGDLTLNYFDWYRRISALVDGLGQIGLRKGDTLVTAMQNRWENASLHWACQLAGIVASPPMNWTTRCATVQPAFWSMTMPLRRPLRDRPLRRTSAWYHWKVKMASP